MIADGTFPAPEPSPDVHTSPRVGDGLIRLDPSGAVESPAPIKKIKIGEGGISSAALRR
jgi:hypothetical protein